MSDPADALPALRAGRAYTARAGEDLLAAHGADVPDLLHRIAASEVRRLDGTLSAPIVFTDDKGRVVDAPTAWRHDDGTLRLLAGPGRGPALRAWIERWVIMEDVTLRADADRVAFDLFGDVALEAAASFVGVVVPARGSVARGRGTLVASALDFGVASGHLVVARDETDAVRVALGAALTRVDDDAIAIHCVQQGIVRPGPALEAGAHPLELGWKDRVSFTKGCYIGQEVVARLDTYDKVKRQVVVLATAHRASTGASVRVDERRVGVVLEGAPTPEGSLALAVIDRAVPPGAALEVENAGAGTLVRIPAPR